jgi:hypothetical protein
MTRRLIQAVSAMLPARSTDAAAVHFHQGAHGGPAACFDARCDRPQLDIG